MIRTPILRAALLSLALTWSGMASAREAAPMAADIEIEKRMVAISEELRCLVCWRSILNESCFAVGTVCHLNYAPAHFDNRINYLNRPIKHLTIQMFVARGVKPNNMRRHFWRYALTQQQHKISILDNDAMRILSTSGGGFGFTL